MTARQKAIAICGALFALLKALPFVRFGLMLGAGLVCTGGVAWVLYLLGYKSWAGIDPAVAIELIHGVTWIGLGFLGCIALVLVALAWGQLDKATVTFAGNSIDLDFETKAHEP